MKNPHLIIIDGPDGTGKSTLAGHLTKAYLDENIGAVHFRDPGSTAVGEHLRSLVLDPDVHMDPTTIMFTFLAARAQMLAEAANDLARGTTVILDRCWASTLAYQAWGQGMGEHVVLDTAEFLFNKLIPATTPIINLYLNAPRQTRLERLADTGKVPDRFESKDEEFYAKVEHGYARAITLAHDVSHHIHHVIDINAAMPFDSVLAHTLAEIHAIHPPYPRGTI